MGTLIRYVVRLTPFPARGRGTATGNIFAVFFYLWAVAILASGRLSTLTAADRVSLLVGWAAIYGAAVMLPAARRAGGGRFRVRFEARRPAFAGLVVLMVMMSAAILAPLIANHAPDAFEDPARTRLTAPSAEHPLGTDRIGRDIFSRVLHGGRVSLGVGVVAVLLSVALALVLGCVTGLSRGWIDDVLSRFTDGMLAFPRLLFVLTLVALFSNSVWLLVVAIGATSWMRIARLVRAEVIRLDETEFVRAATATGVSTVRILTRHMLPNALGPVIVAATLNVGAVILLESYLSFLGLGVQPPTPSWGAMVFEGRDVLVEAWWVSAFPALAITVSVVAFNLVGDGLRDALDARTTPKPDDS